MKPLSLAVLVAAAAITGCGGGGGTSGLVSCTISESIGGDAGLALMLCEETSGASAQQLRQACSASTGGADGGGFTASEQFANGPCSRAGAAGGCRLMSGGMTVTAWYYTLGGFTPDLVSTACSSAGGTFIPP